MAASLPHDSLSIMEAGVDLLVEVANLTRVQLSISGGGNHGARSQQALPEPFGIQRLARDTLNEVKHLLVTATHSVGLSCLTLDNVMSH